MSWLLFCVLVAAPAEKAYLEIVREANAHFDAGRFADAAAGYETAIAKNPHEWQRWYRLAKSLDGAGDFRRAIPAYEKTIELGGLGGTYRADAAYDIARCRARLDESEAAIGALRRALDLGFTDLDRARGDADLAKLRSDPRVRDWLYMIDEASKPSRDEQWRFDLRCFAREIERAHYAPFAKIPREEFLARVGALDAAIPSLSDPAIETRLMALAAAIGDGHTSLFPYAALGSGAPVDLRFFEEGLFVARATGPDAAALVGAEVVRVGESTPAAALEALKAVVSRENDVFLKHQGAGYLRQPRILNGLGLVPDPAKLPLTLRLADGTERAVALEGAFGRPDDSWTSAAKGEPPLSAKNRAAAYWFEPLTPEKTVYAQYNRVGNDSSESLEAFWSRLFAFVEANDVRKLVIDLRYNGGGDMTLNRPLVHGLIQCPKVNRRGALFVIVGRETFSAAMNCAADIERETQAMFVGEPTGSSPNHVGESNHYRLPYSGMLGSRASMYFQRSQPFDCRTFIAPRLYVPPTFADFVANRDAPMAAILAEPLLEPLEK